MVTRQHLSGCRCPPLADPAEDERRLDSQVDRDVHIPCRRQFRLLICENKYRTSSDDGEYEQHYQCVNDVHATEDVAVPADYIHSFLS